MTEPTEAQQRVASLLGLSPFPQYWPMQLINRLVALEEREGTTALWTEINKLLTPPNRCPHCGK